MSHEGSFGGGSFTLVTFHRRSEITRREYSCLQYRQLMLGLPKTVAYAVSHATPYTHFASVTGKSDLTEQQADVLCQSQIRYSFKHVCSMT